MASLALRRSSGSHELFWPGYVDVLSTLLLVVTFLLSIFMVAQFYVSQESARQGHRALRRLTRQIAELTNLLSLEKGQGKSQQDELAALQASLATLRIRQRAPDRPCRRGRREGRAHRRAQQGARRQDKTCRSEAQAKVDLLNQQLLALRRQMAALQEALNAAEAKDKDSQARISDLGARLNVAAGQAGAGAAALPLRLLRPAARAAARPQGHPRRRRPLRVRVGGAVPVRSGDHDGGGPRRHRSAGHGHHRAGALHPARDRLGAAGRRPHRHPAASPARSSPPTGSCPARAPPRWSSI